MSEAGQIIWPVGIAVNDDPTRLVVDATDYDALRDENARLRRVLEQVSFHLAQPGDDETPANQYVPTAAEVGTCQVIIFAALNGGKGVQGDATI